MTLGEVKEVGGEDARERGREKWLGTVHQMCAYVECLFVCFCANDTDRVKTIYIGRVSGTAL